MNVHVPTPARVSGGFTVLLNHFIQLLSYANNTMQQIEFGSLALRDPFSKVFATGLAVTLYFQQNDHIVVHNLNSILILVKLLCKITCIKC